MTNKDAIKSGLRECGIIPVIRARSQEQALQVVSALIEGGIRALEITFTVPGALRCIEAVADRYGDQVLLGAGTVLDAESCRAALLAGARFIVSPALSLATIQMTLRYAAVSVPGALTPTEVLSAWEAGADFVKVFPCDAMGGAKYLKALKAPLPQVELIPTGGVTLETATSFLQAGAAALGVGGDLVNQKDLDQGNWTGLAEKARRFREIVTAFRG